MVLSLSNTFEETINNLISRMNIEIPNIEFITEKEMKEIYGFKASGIYDKHVILLKGKYDISGITAIHEIGHYIHDKYFKNKQIRFSTINKSQYSYTNYMENFAECFLQWFYDFKNKRVEKMDMLLQRSGLIKKVGEQIWN